MSASLLHAFSSMQLSAGRPRQALSFKSSVGGQQLIAAPQRASVVTAAFTVEAKQNSLKRQRTAEKSRLYNKSRKSEIATRMKKVFTALDAFKTTPPAAESDLAPVATLLNEAYACLDKAVVKGVMHRNTADRRKARLAKARKLVLINAGLYTPAQ